MTGKLHWMPFYGVDFYESERVRLMTHAERGLLVAMLWRQWREGSLPSVTADICRMVGSGRIPERVLDHFPVDEDGRRRNPKLEEIRIKHDNLHQALSEAGKRGRAKQLAQARPEPPPGLVRGQAQARLGESESESENNNYHDSARDSERWQSLTSGMDDAGRSAVEGYRRASHDPLRLLAELESLVSGLHGPAGQAVPPPSLGRALNAMVMADIRSLTPNKLLAFCRRELEPERKRAGEEGDELAEWARKKDAEMARKEKARGHA